MIRGSVKGAVERRLSAVLHVTQGPDGPVRLTSVVDRNDTNPLEYMGVPAQNPLIQ